MHLVLGATFPRVNTAFFFCSIGYFRVFYDRQLAYMWYFSWSRFPLTTPAGGTTNPDPPNHCNWWGQIRQTSCMRDQIYQNGAIGAQYQNTVVISALESNNPSEIGGEEQATPLAMVWGFGSPSVPIQFYPV